MFGKIKKKGLVLDFVERIYLPPTTPRMTGITSSKTNTAIIVNKTAPLLMKAVQALERVVFVMAEQSATALMLLSKVIAINPTNTMTAMLIIVLTSTMIRDSNDHY